MARTALTINTTPLNAEIDDVTLDAGDQANGHTFVNDGKTCLWIVNGDASPVTITIVSVADRWGRTGDLSVVVPATSTGFVGPLNPSLFNQSGGLVNVDLTSDTSLTLAAVKFSMQP